MEGVLQISESLPSELPQPSARPREETDGERLGANRPLPAPGARGVRASPGLGQALSEPGDLAARVVDRDRTSGSQARSRVGEPWPGSGQPQGPEPSRP